MSRYLIFAITRAKEISLDIVETADLENEDDFDSVMPHIVPPYQGECIVVKEDNIRRFKLKSNVVEV